MYQSKLNIKQTQQAIQDLKFDFTKQLHKRLHLTRVSAPLFVKSDSKINDGLNGETPVTFFPKGIDQQHEIVHSLAKWKRTALQKYHFAKYEGIYTDMNAIRREEQLDYKHSYYVDQWDWEMIIDQSDRNVDFLKATVSKIYESIKFVKRELILDFPQLVYDLPEELTFITTQELYDLYPNLTPEQRENEFSKKHKAFFVIGVGYKLPDGVEHSKRAFDYDDWTLNGDLIVYDKVNDAALEISSMGIRVDASALAKQKEYLNIDDSKIGEYHNGIYQSTLPFTIGGGIGQSRLSMFLLEKKHIGEVQVSTWNEETKKHCSENNIELL
ncbi:MULTISPECIES: aspartate--ammonia ligase [unclassified Mycoplasma]|uniref:aspartate--ammonia ligase n=1 Tax=unclassified Mycoplasma TaxID=2683645 RepID=UPI00211CD426|nr:MULTISPECIES: aspartate--ammonia ligase [unclassified Mycoplasma]UUM20110.1 aspartate--ammonia ligase [Mycoplasma sp. 1578d]UUM25090.1 aspartate--ammonia ligase [Mycoplasma sp. 3686d]